MGPIWGRQDPGELYVGSINIAIWIALILMFSTKPMQKSLALTETLPVLSDYYQHLAGGRLWISWTVSQSALHHRGIKQWLVHLLPWHHHLNPFWRIRVTKYFKKVQQKVRCFHWRRMQYHCHCRAWHTLLLNSLRQVKLPVRQVDSCKAKLSCKSYIICI